MERLQGHVARVVIMVSIKATLRYDEEDLYADWIKCGSIIFFV